MLFNPARFAVSALSAVSLLSQSVCGQSSHPTLLKPPALNPFFHLDLRVEASTYVKVLETTTGQANNQGGTITGAINGTVLQLGTEFETYPASANFTESFYNSIFTVNTTDGAIILMSIRAHIHYTENKLHGFGYMEFDTSAPHYQYLIYDNYVAEFEATFPSGKASVDVFELRTSGHF